MVATFGSGLRPKRRGRPLIDVWQLFHAGLLDPRENRVSIVLSDGTRHDIEVSSWVPRPTWRHGSSLPKFICPVCGRGCWRLWASETCRCGCRACAGIPYDKRIPIGEWSTWGNPRKAEARAIIALGRRLRRATMVVRAARRRKDVR